MKHIHSLSVIIVCLLFSPGAWGHDGSNQEKIDSLLKIINTTEGEKKLIAYNRLHTLLMDNLSDNASLDAFLDFSKEYAKYALQQGNIKLQGDIRINNLIACCQMNRFNEVEKQAPQTLEFLKKNNLTDGYFIAYKQLILAYCRQNLFEKALNELQTVYREALQQNDREAQFYMQHLMGLTYMHQDRLDEAERHYRMSIETAEKMGKKPSGLMRSCLELCNMLQATGQFDDFFATATQTEALLEQLKKENPNNTYNIETNNLWTLLAFAYDAKGEFDKAEHYCNLIDSLYGRNAVSQSNTTYIRAHILEARGEYTKAIESINRAIALDPAYLHARYTKVRILSHLENAPFTWAEAKSTIEYADSLRNVTFNAQLDKLRIQYEVEKITAEKERNRHYFLFALGGCLLLTVSLGIWIYYNRQIARKNHALVQQIKELIAQQEIRENEILATTSFVSEEEEVNQIENGFCPEMRKDKLCIAIRDALLKDKIYRHPTLTRDDLIERLGTNRALFIEAFHYCFSMSFSDYVNILRLKDAVTLLEQSDLSIETISEKIGFGTVRTFQRQFNAKYNMTPKDYRNSVQKE